MSSMCWECTYSMRVHVSLTIALVGLQVSGLYVLRSCRCVWSLLRQYLVFIMQMAPPLSHGFMTMDQLFLRLLNADFCCNARLLQISLPGVVTEMTSCIVRVKELVKVEISEGVVVQQDLFLTRGGVMIVIAKKILFQHASLELIPGFICIQGWEQRISLWLELIIHPQLICDQRGYVLCSCCIERCMF